MEKIGVEIIYNTGKKEWIDQLDRGEVEQALGANTSKVAFNNGHYDHTFEIATVKEFVIYELCEECGWDARTGSHARDCPLDLEDESS